MPPRHNPDRSNQILDAASRVFARLGFAPARMDDVASESGLSKGALYLYFRSKEQLIDSLVGRMLVLETRHLVAIRSSEGSVAHRLGLFVDDYTAETIRAAPLSPVILEVYARASRHATVRELLRRYFAGFRQELAALIAEGVDSAEFRAVDADDLAVSLVGQLEGLALLWLLDPEHVQLEETARVSLELLLAGLRPDLPPAAEVTP